MTRADRFNAYERKLKSEKITKEIYKNERYDEIIDFVNTNKNRISEMLETFNKCLKYKMYTINFGFSYKGSHIFMHDCGIYGNCLAFQSVDGKSDYIIIDSTGVIYRRYYHSSYSDLIAKGYILTLDTFDANLVINFEDAFNQFETTFYNSVDACLNDLGV